MFSPLKMVLDAYRPLVRKIDVDKEIIPAVGENLDVGLGDIPWLV